MEQETDIQTLIQNFFQGLSQASHLQGCDQVLPLIPILVTQTLNKALLALISDDEVKAIVFQLDATKAPDADGFSGLFCQQNWDMVGLSLCRAVRIFYDSLIGLLLF